MALYTLANRHVATVWFNLIVNTWGPLTYAINTLGVDMLRKTKKKTQGKRKSACEFRKCCGTVAL